ncbi:MAG: hypothetical protein C4542_04120 [Dehalococcoidia bacterium]|nr:MAG: hypothetical protein C4542_04120 [Dehalococcoidia bacterium]
MKNKIAKYLGVVLTAVMVASMLVMAVPTAAAAPLTPVQRWNTYPIPSTTGMMLSSTIALAGPIAQAVDAASNASGIGTIYAFVNDPALTPAQQIVKSVNGGRTWAVTGSVGQPTSPVIEIVCSPTEGNVVFYVTASTLWMSTDSGATFLAIVSVPVSDAITALDAAKWNGRYIAVVGVDSTLGTATLTAGVYAWDQSDVFNNLLPVGTTTFNGILAKKILSVRMAPTFATDRAVIAMGVAGGVATVRVDINGGAWGAVVADFTIGGAVTAGDIQCPSDFNATTSPIYFIAISDAAVGGVYRVTGNSPFLLDAVRTWTNMSVSGTFASGTATILVGSSVGTVKKSITSGSTFTAVTLRSTAVATAWVLLDRNYGVAGAAGQKMAYVLNVGATLGAFNVSVDSLSTFNQWSMIAEDLLTSTISAIDDLAIGSNGDMFMVTRNNDGAVAIAGVTGGIVTITAGTVSTLVTAAVPADTVVITAAAAGTATITVTNGGVTYGAVTGGTRTANVITFTGAGTCTVSGTVANTQFTVQANIATNLTFPAGTGAPVVTGTDPNFTVQLPNIAAAEVDALTTDTVITGLPLTGITVSPASIWTQGTGTITFTAVGQVATITSTTTTGVIGPFTLTATYSMLVGGATAGALDPVATNGVGGVFAVPGAWGGTGTNRVLTSLTAQVNAVPSTNTSKLWRQIAGGPWERVAVAIATDAQRVIIRLSPAYATDKAVFYTIVGSAAAIKVSTNNANSFADMASAPGANVSPTAVNALLPLNSTNVVVGDAAGNLVTNTTAYWWIKGANSPFGVGYIVSDIESAGGTNLVAVATNGTNLRAAKSADNGLTWTLLRVPGSTTTTSTLTVTSGPASIAPAADYATTGNVFVSAVGGLWRYPSIAAGATASGWLLVDATAPVTNTAAAINFTVYNPGLVTTPGGPGSVTEGAGMVYAGDNSAATGDVVRVRGLEATAENLDSAVTSRPAVVFAGLWSYPSASGNVLFTIDGTASTPKLYTYNDTLAIAGTGVAISNLATPLATSTAVVTFNLMPNANGYVVVVNPVRQTSLYTAVNGAGVAVSAVTVGATTGFVTVTLMAPGTTYYASVWAILTTTAPANVMSSFMFGGSTSFVTPLPFPVTPMNLVPIVGAINVPVLPQFGWMAVPGATSYTLQIALATGNFASPLYSNNAVPAGVAGAPTVTWNYTGPALSFNTSYQWRVRADIAGGGSSAWVDGNFTTEKAVVPPVTVTQAAPAPVPTIILSQQPVVTITQAAPIPAPTLTLPPQQTIVLTTPPAGPTPAYIWVIVGVGALLTLAVIVLIIRTRRVV